MFYRIITGDKTITALIVIIFAILSWLPGFISTEKFFFPDPGSSMPMYDYIFGIFNKNLFVSKGIALSLVLLQGVFLVRINAKFVLIQQRTFLPAFFFIILSGFLPELHQLNAVLIASVFIIFTLAVLLRSYDSSPNSYDFFLAGLLLGSGSLIYAPMIYFLVFVWISTSFLRTFYWREYVLPVLGLLTPYLFYFGWMILYDVNIPAFFHLLKHQLFAGFQFLNMKLLYGIFTVYVIFLILISSVYMIKIFQFRKIYLRNFFLMKFWLFMTAIFVFAAFTGFNTRVFYIISVPVSYLLTNYFINSRKSLTNRVLFFLLILGALFLMIARTVNWI
jgi:hypothetical protein